MTDVRTNDAPAAAPDAVATLSHAVDNLNRAQREAGARLAREIDVSRAGLAVILVLARCGEIHLTDLAEHLRVDLSVASRQVTHLVDRGLVDRNVPHDDRRARILALTPAGHQMADTAHASIRLCFADAFAGWPADQIAEVVRAVAHLTSALDDVACRTATLAATA